MYNTAFQQPAMGMTGMPVVNNFPIVGQPVNMTQSGVNFDQIKQLLVNRITSNKDSDIAGAELYRQCIGINGSWFTEKLNSLIQTTAMTIDVMYRANPLGKSMEQIIPEAIEEVYSCAWALMLRNHPQLMSDPSMQQGGRLTIAQQWQNIADQRVATFKSLGLMNQQPIMNVTPMQTPAFQNGGMPSMGFGGVQTMTNGNMTSQYFNRPGFSNPFGGTPAVTSQNNPYAIPGLSTPGISANTPMGFRPAANPSAGEQQSMSLLTHNQSAQDRIREISERNRRLREQGLYNEEGNNTPVNTQSTPHVFPNPQAKPTQTLEAPVNINQVPQRQGLGIKQPYEVKTSLEQHATAFAQPQLTPNTPTWQDQVRSLTETSTTSNGITEYNLSDLDTLTNIFTEVKKEEHKEDGLAEDEVRYLTRKEMRELRNKRYLFEYPNVGPAGANPFFYHHFAVLTTKNTVRQIIEPIGESMRPEVHDINARLRNDPVIRRSPNAGKIIPTTANFNHSTIGGVVYDRFKLSKATLQEDLAKAREVEDLELRKLMFRDAYERFGENIEKDLENDYNGLSAYRAANPSEDGEDDDFTSQFFTKEELDKRKEQSKEFLKSIKSKEPIYIEGVHEITNLRLMDTASTDEPIEEDIVKVNIYTTERIVKGYNKPSDKEVDEKLLDIFHWRDEIDANNKQREFDIDADQLAKLLKENKEKLPSDLWSRLNRQATIITNEAIKYILGLDDVTIDSFADDYLDLYPWLKENLDLTLFTNAEMAVNYLDGYITQQLRTLHKLEELVISQDDVDVSDLRFLGEKKYYLVAECPFLPETIGSEENEITLTDDVGNGLFPILADMLKSQISSRASRREYSHTINGVLVSFADGSTYKVFPTLGRQPKYKDTDDKFYRVITLVRVDTTA